MKKALSLLLVLVLLLSLCACGNTQSSDSSTTPSQATDNAEELTTDTTEAPTTTPTEEPITTPTETPTTEPTEAPAPCSHSYKDATCTAPKTCNKCGATSGSALGHNYVNGVCTGCGDKKEEMTAITDLEWYSDVVLGTDEDGTMMDHVVLKFYADGSGYFNVSHYMNYTDQEMVNAYIELGHEPYIYDGKWFFNMGFGWGTDIESYEINGNSVTFTTSENYQCNSVTFTITRTATNEFTLTYVGGLINDYANAIVPGIVFKGQTPTDY